MPTKECASLRRAINDWISEVIATKGDPDDIREELLIHLNITEEEVNLLINLIRKENDQLFNNDEFHPEQI